MSCPDDNAWAEYLDHDLTSAEHDELERHLDHCEACRAVLAGVAPYVDGQITGPDPAAPELSQGFCHGRYRPTAVLGAGGMGMVYEAIDVELDRPVAVKLALHAGEEAHRRLKREAQAMARLRHPHVVGVFDVVAEEEQLIVVCERVHGESLNVWLRAASRTTAAILRVLVDGAYGLAAIHRAGLLHRDVTLANILVDDRGRGKVCDLGLAMQLHSHDPSLVSSVSGALGASTHTGAGTPGYVAPEVFDGGVPDTASDQFTFCVTATAALQEHRDPLARRAQAILDRGLDPSPSRRYASMDELAAKLSALRSGGRTWRSVAWSAGFAILVATGASMLAAPSRPAPVDGPCAADPVRWTPQGVGSVDGRGQAHADTWNTAWSESCVARAAETISQSAWDLRWQCLHRARAELEAVRDTMATLSRDQREARASDLAAQLESQPSPADCVDDDALARRMQLAPTGQRAAIAEVRERIARSKAQFAVGRVDEARAALEALNARAADLDFPPLLAEVKLQLGEMQIQEGDVSAGLAMLDRAGFIAAGAGAEWTAVEARLAWIRQLSTTGGAPAEAIAALPEVDAYLARLDHPPHLMVQRAQGLTLAYAVLGDGVRSAEYADEAIAACRSLHGEGSRCEAVTAYSAGLAHARLRQPARAEQFHRKAIDLFAELFGTRVLWVWTTQLELARAVFAQQRVEEALTLARSATEAIERRLGPDHVYTIDAVRTLANLHHDAGQHSAALPMLRRVVAHQTSDSGSAEVYVFDRLALASSLIAAGAPPSQDAVAEAHRYIEQALHASTAEVANPDLKGLVLGVAGSIALQGSDPEGALGYCTRALETLSAGDPNRTQAQDCIDEAIDALRR